MAGEHVDRLRSANNARLTFPLGDFSLPVARVRSLLTHITLRLLVLVYTATNRNPATTHTGSSSVRRTPSNS